MYCNWDVGVHSEDLTTRVSQALWGETRGLAKSAKTSRIPVVKRCVDQQLIGGFVGITMIFIYFPSFLG